MVRLEYCILSGNLHFQERSKAINGSSDDKNEKKVKCSIYDLKRLNKLGLPSLKKRTL